MSYKDIGFDFRDIDSYMFKGFFYGKITYKNVEYYVFKYKEPSLFANNGNENKNSYKLFINNNYNNNSPITGDKNRLLFGMKNDFRTTGHMVVNSDIATTILIPIEIKFFTNVIKYKLNGEYIKNTKISPLSNGTGIFILKINVEQNNKIYNPNIYLDKYNIYKQIEEEDRFDITIYNQPGFSLSMPSWEYSMKTNQGQLNI